MGLINFITSALPWIGKAFLKNSNNAGLLDKFENLAQELSGTEGMDAYNKVLLDSKLLLEFQQSAWQLQQEYAKHVCKDRMNARKRDLFLLQKNGKNYRADKMIYIACFGLICCMAVLGFGSSVLTAELVAIISTTMGVFGSCLKDAYVFEFGQGKNFNMSMPGKNNSYLPYDQINEF